MPYRLNPKNKNEVQVRRGGRWVLEHRHESAADARRHLYALTTNVRHKMSTKGRLASDMIGREITEMWRLFHDMRRKLKFTGSAGSSVNRELNNAYKAYKTAIEHMERAAILADKMPDDPPATNSRRHPRRAVITGLPGQTAKQRLLEERPTKAANAVSERIRKALTMAHRANAAASAAMRGMAPEARALGDPSVAHDFFKAVTQFDDAVHLMQRAYEKARRL